MLSAVTPALANIACALSRSKVKKASMAASYAGEALFPRDRLASLSKSSPEGSG
jgi:hypothetical protein